MNALSQKRPKNIIQNAMKNPAKVLAVGIDIAKTTHIVRAMRGNGERLKNKFSCSSSPDSLHNLAEWIINLKKDYKINHVFIGMEPTGLFWYPVYDFLKDYMPDCGVYQVLPQAVCYNRKIKSSNLSKDDVSDAFLIADLIRQGQCRRPIQHTLLTRQIRNALHRYMHVDDEAINWKRQLLSILQRVFPEAVNNVNERNTDSILNILRDMPRPVDITAISENAWIEKHVTRGRARTKLRALYKNAVTSLGYSDDSYHWKTTWDISWSAWNQTKKHREKFKNLIESLVNDFKYVDALKSIPGIGTMTIAAFLAGAGDIYQYKRASQIEKVFGFDLQRCQSGKTEATPHITKRGYSPARKYFFMGAMTASQLAPFNSWYNRHIYDKEQKGKIKTIIALAAKLTRICFHIARTGEKFDPEKAVNIIERE